MTTELQVYERDDWTLFRTLQGLAQKAGVSETSFAALYSKRSPTMASTLQGDAALAPCPMAAAISLRTSGAGLMVRPKTLRGCSQSIAHWCRPSCCGSRREVHSATDSVLLLAPYWRRKAS